MGRRSKILKSVRRRVYERDDWTCQYCGLRIEPRAADERDGTAAPSLPTGPTSWISLELDHVVPHSAGGPGTVGNLRAACSPCNRRKSHVLAHDDWQGRFDAAIQIMHEGPADIDTARRAAMTIAGTYVTVIDTAPKEEDPDAHPQHQA